MCRLPPLTNARTLPSSTIRDSSGSTTNFRCRPGRRVPRDFMTASPRDIFKLTLAIEWCKQLGCQNLPCCRTYTVAVRHTPTDAPCPLKFSCFRHLVLSQSLDAGSSYHLTNPFPCP